MICVSAASCDFVVELILAFCLLIVGYAVLPGLAWRKLGFTTHVGQRQERVKAKEELAVALICAFACLAALRQ